MVGAGLALVGTGGALLFWGKARSQRLPRLSVGFGGVGVSKTVSW
jgi:hypothetical protein